MKLPQSVSLKHGIAQVAPPLLLVFPLFGRSGPGLWLALGLGILVAAFSAISLLIRLIRFNREKYNLIRPSLALLIVGVIYLAAVISFDVAYDEVKMLAKQYQSQCQDEGLCPDFREGGDERIKNISVGGWYAYNAQYVLQEDAAAFELSLYQSNDVGVLFTGGSGERRLQEQRYAGP